MQSFRCVLFALIVLTLTARTHAQQGEYKTITLTEPCESYAVDSKTGTIAGTRAARKEVVLFPKLFSEQTVDDAKTVKLDDEPVQVLYKPRAKGGVFLVLSKKGDKIAVLDPTTAMVTKTITINPTHAGRRLLCSQQNDPYVYCLCQSSDNEPIRIHLDSGAQQSVGRIQRAHFGAVTADGKIFYHAGNIKFPVFGLSAMELLPDSGGVVSVRNLNAEHRPVSFFLPDPHGQFVVCGEDVYSPDLRRKLDKLSLMPLLISARRPLMFGYAGMLSQTDLFFEPDLRVLSTNTMTALGVIKGVNPVTETQKTPTGPGFANQLAMFEDPKGDAIALCRLARIHIIPIKAFGITPEPRLLAQVGGSTELMVGHPAALTFAPHDPATKMALDSAPKGVVYAAGKLTWTPGRADVGAHTVVLKLSAGALQRKQEVKLIVRAPSIELANLPDLFHLSESSQSGVFFSHGDPMSKNATYRMTVVDLKQLKVIATKLFAAPIDTLACDAHHVYAGYTNLDADFLLVLDRNTLRQVKLIRVKTPIRHIVPVADRLVFALPVKKGLNEGGNWMVLKTPDLQPATPSDLPLGIQLTRDGEASTAPLRADEGWYFQGVLYDGDFRKLRLVLHPFVGFNAGYVEDMQKRQAAPQLLKAFGFRSWGVHVQGLTLMHGTNKVGALGTIVHKKTSFFNQLTPVVLPWQPVAATLEFQSQWQNSNTVTHDRITLTYHDLLTARRLDEFTLLDENPRSQGLHFTPDHQRPEIALHVLGRKLIALVGYSHRTPLDPGSTRLFVIDPPRFDASKAAPPLHFEAEHAATVVKGEALVPLPKLIGAPDTVQLKLKQDIPGIQVDAKARALRVDEAELQRSFRKHLQSDQPVVEPSPGKTPLEAYALTKERNAQVFEKLMGRKATGLPQWVRVEVLATDKDQGEALTSFGFFIEVPEAPILAKLKGEPEPGVEQTVRDLESRVKSLEMQVDRLQKSLDQLNRLLEAKAKGK